MRLGLHEVEMPSKGINRMGELDDLLGGLRPNELTVLTGETASGKTTWAANLGFDLQRQSSSP